MTRLSSLQKVLDNVAVPLNNGTAVSEWFQATPARTEGVRPRPDAAVFARVRLVESGSGANVSYELEGTPDGGVSVYSIQADAAGVVVELADVELRVKATNASGVGAETANAWLIAVPSVL